MGPVSQFPTLGPPHYTLQSNTSRGLSGIFESTGLDICPNLMGRMGPNEPVGHLTCPGVWKNLSEIGCSKINETAHF
jgi:hypothetical protein